MSKKVLVIDDEEPVAEAMSQLCQQMGFEVQTCLEAAQVMKLVEEFVPDLVILDLFLPGSDGMKLAAQIRSSTGPKLGMLAVSGVLKQASTGRELWQKFQCDFLGKPFDNKAFQTKVAQRLGIPVPGQAAEQKRRAPHRAVVQTPEATDFQSLLAQDPAYRIYLRLYEQRASGHLELVRGKARRRITFHHGQIRHASSNLAKENVGMMQVANGTIEEEAFRKAVELAQKKKLPLADALLKKKVLGQGELDRALAMQVEEVATAAMGWADGEASFVVDPHGAAATPDHRIHPLKAILEGVRRFYPTETLKSFLGQRQAAYLVRTPLLDRESYTLRQVAPGERVTPQIAGTITLGILMDQVPDEDLPLLFALVGTGLLRLSKTAQDSAAPAEAAPPPSAPAGPARGAPGVRPPGAPGAPPLQRPPPAAPPPSITPPTMGGPATPAPAPAAPPAAAAPVQVDLDAGQVFSPEDQQARAEIARMHKAMAEQSHYEVLGVPHNARDETIQQAYLELARQWHTDRFAGFNLGAAAPKLEEIFARIGAAKENLADKERRAEYDVYLDRKARGLPTDVGQILKAQELFEKAAILVKAGKAPKALPLLQQAIELDHSQAEFYVYRAYARFLTEGDAVAAESRAQIEKALQELPRLAEGYFFLGLIALKAGNDDEATSHFKRVLSIEANHGGAQQQLRVLARRQEKGKGGGLLGRLRGK
ncbi:MAG: response regulator [Deltaproteobacteria bacterium]|nr:response regulator [Deltaproteobacteria bacterium]